MSEKRTLVNGEGEEIKKKAKEEESEEEEEESSDDSVNKSNIEYLKKQREVNNKELAKMQFEWPELSKKLISKEQLRQLKMIVGFQREHLNRIKNIEDVIELTKKCLKAKESESVDEKQLQEEDKEVEHLSESTKRAVKKGKESLKERDRIEEEQKKDNLNKLEMELAFRKDAYSKLFATSIEENEQKIETQRQLGFVQTDLEWFHNIAAFKQCKLPISEQIRPVAELTWSEPSQGTTYRFEETEFSLKIYRHTYDDHFKMAEIDKETGNIEKSINNILKDKPSSLDGDWFY